MHRQLKAELKVQPNPASWVDALPLVLLSIRTTVKEDISATTAEMVYGTMQRLPGELFQASDSKSIIDPTDYVSQLKMHMQYKNSVSCRHNTCGTMWVQA